MKELRGCREERKENEMKRKEKKLVEGKISWAGKVLV